MKKLVQHLLVALTTFGAAAGASVTLQKMKSAHEPAAAGKEAAHAAADGHGESAHARKPAPHHEGSDHEARADEPPIRVAMRTSYAPGVEETVRLASSLRDRATHVREREDQLTARQRQLDLVIENIRSERAAIDELRTELDAVLKAGEDHMADVQKHRTELEIKQQDIDGRITEMAGHEKDNMKKMAGMYDNMPAENAAKIIQHMADNGTMDTAVKLLASMKDRQAAKVLAEMPDPSLAAQLSERLRDFKHPRTPAK